MAGIGFELRKVIGRGHLGNVFQAALSGIMIVAGPWLMSILSITLISQIMGREMGAHGTLFISIIVYSYAFSISLFGGFHYIFTRLMADKLFDNLKGDAASILFLFLIFLIPTAGALSAPFIFQLKPEIDNSALFRVSSLILFLSTNCIWLLMIFISLLRQYMKILFIYLGGMAASVIFVFLFHASLGISGAMFGFALGHVLIVLLLSILSFSQYKPSRPFSFLKEVPPYFRRYFLLFLTGLFYSCGIWIDKIVYWFIRGSVVPGTPFALYEMYDISAYFANLSMIPGLVYFVIISETSFYISLKKFLISLNKSIYKVIQRNKYQMISTLSENIRNQSFFQAVFTGILIFTVPFLFSHQSHGPGFITILQTTLGSVYFHLLFLTLLNFLFYLELYAHACFACAVFFFGNMGITLLDILPGISVMPGVGYGISAFASACISGFFLYKNAKIFDRKVLTRTA